MTRLATLALSFALATPSHALWPFSSKEEAPKAVGAVISAATGSVRYIKPGQAARPATQRPIHAKDRVKTGADGQAVIMFLDGTKIKIGKNSEFELTDHDPKKVNVRLLVGRVTAWVKRVQNRRFALRTPTAVASVRGTTLGAETNPPAFDLFSGAMDVTDNFGNTVPMTGGQTLGVDAQRGVQGQTPQTLTKSPPPEPKADPAAAKKKAAEAKKKADDAKKKAKDLKDKAEKAKKAGDPEADKLEAQAEDAAIDADKAEEQADLAEEFSAIEEAGAEASGTETSSPTGTAPVQQGDGTESDGTSETLQNEAIEQDQGISGDSSTSTP